MEVFAYAHPHFNAWHYSLLLLSILHYLSQVFPCATPKKSSAWKLQKVVESAKSFSLLTLFSLQLLKMACVCESCKSLEMHKYWREVSPRKHKFMKIMLGNFENQLRIPRKFISCFPRDLSRSCVLKGQSGNVWKVQVINSEEDTLFSNGWGNFARDHDIKIGYFLVFCYVSDSTFEVSIFDRTMCEVEGSYFTKNSNNVSSQTSCKSVLHSENDEGRRNAESAAPIKGKGKVDEVLEDTDMLESEEEDLDDTSDEGIQEGFHSSSSTRTRITQGRQSKTFYISGRRKVTEQEKQAAFNKANLHIMNRSKSSREHMFKIKMLQSHVTTGFHLTIPKEWALKHILRTSHDVTLRVPGVEGTWIVGCRWTRSQCQIRPGWSTFVLENNVEEHDVCVFELEKKGKSAKKTTPLFDVRIFRVIDEVVPLTVSRRV